MHDLRPRERVVLKIKLYASRQPPLASVHYGPIYVALLLVFPLASSGQEGLIRFSDLV